LTRRLGIRSRLLLAVVGVVALAIVALVGSFNYILASRLSASATATARAQAEAEVETIQIRHGQIAPDATSDAEFVGSQVWVLDGRGNVLESPRGAGALQRQVLALARRGGRTADIPGLNARLYAVPVSGPQQRFGTVVAAISTKAYRETQETALIGSIILAFAMLGAIGLAAHWILRAALSPVTEMTASAAAWSERDLERRFGLGVPHDELTELGATLDSLLDRLAASLRHEQRLTAELSHELRTPLARISGEAELALSREREAVEYREAFESVFRDAAQMTATVDALVAAARQESGLFDTTSDARDAVTRATDAARPLAAAAGIEIAARLPPAPVNVSVESELIDRILQPLLENACHYGRSRVDVAITSAAPKALISIVDDGDGIASDEPGKIFEPGRRGRAAAGRSDGSGLGLALALRVARSAGGSITAQPEQRGGHFIVELPLA
jgi:signal transduction histidine kinase